MVPAVSQPFFSLLIMVHIQFHWQFLIMFSGFWLVNNLLCKFDTSSKKNMAKTQLVWWKTTTKFQKSICKHSAAFFTLRKLLTRDVTCSKLYKERDQKKTLVPRNCQWKILFIEIGFKQVWVVKDFCNLFVFGCLFTNIKENYNLL